MKKIIFAVCLIALLTAGTSFAKTKGHYHFKGNCRHAACHCTEFLAEAGTSTCYYCGHMDYMHR